MNIAGTDTPARPYLVSGFALHDELALYLKAGECWNVARNSFYSLEVRYFTLEPKKERANDSDTSHSRSRLTRLE